MEVNEFDFKGEHEVIYDENGVVIRSFPAIHSIDGSVSFSLEWNDLKFVFSSDSYPNKWFVEYAKDSDLCIHECFIAVPDLVNKMRFTPESALQVGTQVHTAPEAFGKIMSAVQPRMAVAYHFFNDWDTSAAVHDGIRKTYDGPLSLAEDFMVWNITKDAITTRIAVTEEATWPPHLPPRLFRQAPTTSRISKKNVGSMRSASASSRKEGSGMRMTSSNRSTKKPAKSWDGNFPIRRKNNAPRHAHSYCHFITQGSFSSAWRFFKRSWYSFNTSAYSGLSARFVDS